MISLSDPQPPRLLDLVRSAARYRHFALSTKKLYVHWVRAFVKFHGLRHPRELGEMEVESYLTHLANERRVSASTHRQALSALLFLYKDVLKMDLPWMANVGRPRAQQRIPVVLTVDEVRRSFLHVDGVPLLIAQLLYGTGMRILEACANPGARSCFFSKSLKSSSWSKLVLLKHNIKTLRICAAGIYPRTRRKNYAANFNRFQISSVSAD